MTPGQRADAIIEDNIKGIASAAHVGDEKFGRGFYAVWVLDTSDAHALRVARRLANTPKRQRQLKMARIVERAPCLCVPVQNEVSERMAGEVHGGMARAMKGGAPAGYLFVVAPVKGGGAWCQFEHVQVEADDEDEG